MTEVFLKYKKYVLFVLVGAIFLILSFLKNGFYVDEIYSYGHANSSNGAYFEKHFQENSELNYKDKFYHQWLDGSLFNEWLTVQKDEAFHYSAISENLKQSVHPPLFYYLLHTICSLVPETFHKALGLGLNFVVLVLLFYFFYRLAKEVFSDEKKAFVATAFFMFVPMVLQMQIYIRMYLLLMALMTGLWWQIFAFFNDDNVSLKRLLFIFCLAFLSFLTHYYALIMVFFLTATFCIVLFLQKKYLKSVALGAIILFSLMISFLFFKEAYQVLLFSDRGEETKLAVTGLSWRLIADATAFLWLQICHLLLGISDILSWIILPVVLVFLICAKLNVKGYILLFAGGVSGFIIAILAPNMGEFNGRYYGGVLVPLFLVLAMVADNLFKKKINGKTVFGLWLLFSLFTVYQMRLSSYLQRDSEVSEICEITAGKKVILQRQLFMSVFQLAPCWQEAQRIYIIGQNETPENILDIADAGTVFIQEVGQGTKKYLSHALYEKNHHLGLSYIGMYRADKILYDIYAKKEGTF